MPEHAPLPGMGLKDAQTATPDGQVLGPTIDGAFVRSLTTLPDARGEICELISAAWPEAGGFSTPHVYLATARVGIVKGWIVHQLQTDHLAFINGAVRVVLYDGRSESPTFGTVKEIFGGERARMLVVIPPGVWHAVQNVGEAEAIYINCPDRAYDHADPDKHRLPIDTELIPFSFAPPQL